MRGRPTLRVREPSYLRATSCRYHPRIVSGRTMWQQALRSLVVNSLPLMARRRRWSAVKAKRLLPVGAVATAP